MRATVLVSEYLVYIPAVIALNRRYSRLSGINVWESSIALVAMLMQPATMLIDHGHFQYNTVMLGFVLASISSMLAGRLLWSCVFFVAALSFKQMALYFAPVVFAYLLGLCIKPRLDVARFITIALVTVVAFAIVFAPILLGLAYEHNQKALSPKDFEPPYLLTSLRSYLPFDVSEGSFLYILALQLTQVVHRIFPLARGIFEDKVANLWCAIHTFCKLHRFSTHFLSRVSLLATLISIFPSCITMVLAPRKSLLPYALASCAWGFFLCSFQVHEKSVLLPLLPVTLLLGGEHGLGVEIRAWVGLANLLGTWTMFPLLRRDQLAVPYSVLALLWAYLLGLPPTSLSMYVPSQKSLTSWTKLLHSVFYLSVIGWHIVEAFFPPPASKPHLWVVLNCLIGAGGFGICYAWCTWQMLQKSGVVEKLSARPAKGARDEVAAREPRRQANGSVNTRAKRKVR